MQCSIQKGLYSQVFAFETCLSNCPIEAECIDRLLSSNEQLVYQSMAPPPTKYRSDAVYREAVIRRINQTLSLSLTHSLLTL